ncbi:hypothetical protein Tco_0887148 [Tanacetum coccineum]
MILLMAENQISPFFMYSGLSVIPKMIVKTLGNLVEKVTLAFSLVILLIAVLTDSGLDLTYAPSTITTQEPTEHELDLLFEAMYDDYIGGQPSAAPRNVSDAQAPHVLQTPTVSTTIADTTPTLTNSSSQAKHIPNTSPDIDELETQQQHDHPLEQVIGEPSRPVLTRNQLRSDGDMCMYALTVSTIEPKNVKEAMNDPELIELMQEELL